MGKAISLLLATMLLAACGPGDDKKPVLEQERKTMQNARQVDNMQQQQAEKQRQEMEKQAQ